MNKKSARVKNNRTEKTSSTVLNSKLAWSGVEIEKEYILKDAIIKYFYYLRENVFTASVSFIL